MGAAWQDEAWTSIGLVSYAASDSFFIFAVSQGGAAVAASPWAMGFSPCFAGLIIAAIRR